VAVFFKKKLMKELLKKLNAMNPTQIACEIDGVFIEKENTIKFELSELTIRNLLVLEQIQKKGIKTLNRCENPKK
jgi:hypothetical protein